MQRIQLRSFLCVVALVVISILLFYGPTDNWNWDPSFYYAQMRAPIIDHSLDFRNETKPPHAVPARTVTGLEPSVWPVGPSILWAPFFLLAHVFVLLVRGPQTAHGFSTPYIAAVTAGSALYGLLGLCMTYRICRLFTGRGLALIVSVSILLASPLFYYIYRQPLMGHSTGFLATSLLLYVVIQIERQVIPLRWSGLLIGVFVGLNVLVRWIGITAVVLPAVLFARYVISALQRHDRPRIRMLIGQMSIALICALLVFLPQLALWHRLYNAWIVPPVGSQPFTFRLLPPFLFDLFFHTNRGLLYWAPLVMIGMVGLLCIKPLALRAMLVAYLAGVLYVLGSWVTWHGGGGFGARYFIETLPVVAIGVVVLIRPIWGVWWGRVVVTGLSVLLIVQQFVLVVMVEQVWLPLQTYFSGGPLGLRYQAAAWQRLATHPAAFFLSRPGIAAAHQAVLTNVLADDNSSRVYAIPLGAVLVVSLGLVLCCYGARLRRLPLVAGLLMLYTVGWFWFLLAI